MMIDRSPDYAITKPGMPQILRKREKSLRTYGRQSASTPPTKARIGPQVRSESTLLHVATDRNSERVPLEASPSSILRYFRPLPAESKPQRAVKKGCDAALRNSMSSVRARRKPRLLRIRGPSLLSGDALNLSGEDKDETDSSASFHDAKRKSLRDRGDNLLNRDRGDGDFYKDRMKDRLGLKSSPGVQTTLNISSQAAFAECKVCDMVWNPLYPDDVRFHDKRHKSVLRMRRKRQGEEL